MGFQFPRKARRDDSNGHMVVQDNLERFRDYVDSALVQNADAGWVSFSLSSPWTNYGTPFQTAGYRRLVGGLIILKGLVINSIAASGANSLVSTLPVGYRPVAQVMATGLQLSGAMARVDVRADGTIVVVAAMTINTWISLEQIKFLGEQ